jgi:hypothetical protein
MITFDRLGEIAKAIAHPEWDVEIEEWRDKFVIRYTKTRKFVTAKAMPIDVTEAEVKRLAEQAREKLDEI